MPVIYIPNPDYLGTVKPPYEIMGVPTLPLL